MRRVVKNQVFQSRVINQLGPAKLSPSRNRGHNSNNNAAEGVIIINVWHTVWSVTIPTLVDLPLPQRPKEYGYRIL
jgi:hypothetical protein